MSTQYYPEAKAFDPATTISNPAGTFMAAAQHALQVGDEGLNTNRPLHALRVENIHDDRIARVLKIDTTLVTSMRAAMESINVDVFGLSFGTSDDQHAADAHNRIFDNQVKLANVYQAAFGLKL